MPLLHAIVLGVVQGLTEFLPVSSSGHLILVPALLGWPEQSLAFDTVLHLGTLCAVIGFFWKDLLDLARLFFKPTSLDSRMLVWKWIVASLPALVLGFLLNDWIEAYVRGARIVAFDLAFWGLVLWIVDRRSRTKTPSIIDWKTLTWKQALWMGCAQPVALLPGSSRSGITMTAGLFSGLSRDAVLRFSFFLSIPLTGAAGANGLFTLIRQGLPSHDILALALGFVTAFASGAWAIKFLLSYVSKRGFTLFVWYRLVLALVVLWFVR